MTRGQYLALCAAVTFSLAAVLLANWAVKNVVAMRGEAGQPRRGEFSA